jgi:hypothetical protein
MICEKDSRRIYSSGESLTFGTQAEPASSPLCLTADELEGEVLIDSGHR